MIEMNKCKKCNTEELDMYYVEYCPKCDIQDMIYEKPKTRVPVIFFPVRDYGLKYVPEFTEKMKHKLWDDMLDDGTLSNDSYYDFTLDIRKPSHAAFKKVLDELQILYVDNKILFWISW